MLRFLQDQKFERVGGRATISVNVRVLAATNKPLEKMIEDGTFREDLYYRLNGIRIPLPPLRDRDGDALMLAHHFMNIFCHANYRSFRGLQRGCGARHQRIFLARQCPRAGEPHEARRGDGGGPVDHRRRPGFGRPRRAKSSIWTCAAHTQRLERKLVQEAMAITQGNVSKAAKLLGVSRPHLYSLTKGTQL